MGEFCECTVDKTFLCLKFSSDPTPDTDDLDNVLPVKWEPVANFNETHVVNYLDITSRLEMRDNPETERLSFWDDMYMHYNGNVM